MSIPDIDYELRDVGQAEYSIPLADARTPEDMDFVAKAFRAGQLKERVRIDEALSKEAKGYDNLNIALFKLRKIIHND